MAAGTTSGTEAAPARPGNPFGLLEALFGLAAGFVLGELGIGAYSAAEHLRSGQVAPLVTTIGVIGLWIGFAGGALFASRVAHGRGGARPAQLRSDYRIFIRPWPDIPLGLLVGVASQYILVPVVDLVLQPFVTHLNNRLSHPARQLLGPVTHTSSATLAGLAVLVCVGSPLFEELFFRGLFFRGLVYRTARFGRRLGPAIAIVVTGLFFALVHFEALQFLGLAAFGMVLSYLAWRSGRLGPCFVAHLAFNTTAVLTYVYVR